MDFSPSTKRYLQRNRVFHDRTNPFHTLDDEGIYERFRFLRIHDLDLVDELREHLLLTNRKGVLPPLLQVFF